MPMMGKKDIQGKKKVKAEESCRRKSKKVEKGLATDCAGRDLRAR